MIPPEMALSPPEGLLQSLQTLMTISLARPLEKTWKIFDERVKVRQLLRRNCEKSKLKNNMAIISYLQEAAAVKISY